MTKEDLHSRTNKTCNVRMSYAQLKDVKCEPKVFEYGRYIGWSMGPQMTHIYV